MKFTFSYVYVVMLMVTIFTIQPSFSEDVSIQDSKKIVTVIVNGFGKDIPDAAQNAAQNALSNVVGTFMDSSKILEKKTTIQSGILNETKNIKTDIKEYSQGTIKGFELIDSSVQDGLTKITAKVSVRIEDLRAYINKIAQGEAEINSGLFVKMHSAEKQQKNKVDLLLDNVIGPIVSKEVIQFHVGPPALLNDISYEGKNPYVNSMIDTYGANSIITFHVDMILNPDFHENMLRTISSISSDEKVLSVPTFSNSRAGFSSYRTGSNRFGSSRTSAGKEDLQIYLVDGRTAKKNEKRQSNTEGTKYLIEDVFKEAAKKYRWLFSSSHQYYKDPEDPLMTGLEIIIVDGDGKSLQKEIIMPNYNMRYNKRWDGADRIYAHSYDEGESYFLSSWHFLGKPSDSRINNNNDLIIAEARSFDVFLSVNSNVLKSAKKIIVRFLD